MKVIKFLINILLSFILMILIVVIFGKNTILTKVLDKNYITSKLDSTGFYNQLSLEIDDGFTNYVYQSGLPENIIDNLYNNEMLKNDIDSIISYIYVGTDISTSEEIIKTNIDNNIQLYLNENNIKLNEHGKANIENYENLISKEYKKKIVVSENIYTQAKNVIKLLNKVNKYMVYVYVVVAIDVMLMVFINRKNLLDAINFAGISFLSVGIVFKIILSFINHKINFNNLMIYSKSVTNLIVNIVNDFMSEIGEYTTLFIVIGMVSILITALLNSIDNSGDAVVDKSERKPKQRKRSK